MDRRSDSTVTAAPREPTRELVLETFEHGDACVVLDPEFRVVLVNAEQERLSATPRSRSMGRVAWEVWPHITDPRGKFWTELNRAMRDRMPVQFEEYDPVQALWLDLRVYPAADGGIAVFSQDVTARKRAEEALRRAEEGYRTLAENAPEVIARFDRQLRHTYVNEYGARVYGVAAREVVGRTNADLGMPPDQVAFWKRHFEEVFATGEQRTVEFHFDSPTFGRRFFSSLFVPERDEAGEITSILAITRDVTERRRVESALRDTEAKFRSVFEQAAVGMARVRFSDARWIDVNDAFCRMLARSRDEMLRTPWPEMTHPEDVDLDLVPFRRMAAGELESYTVEKRFLHRDGHHVWARLTLSLVRRADGTPDYEVAIVEDVTERKRAEHALSRSEQRLRAIFEGAAVGIVEVDEEDRFVAVNGRFCSMLGYAREELLGKRPHDITAPEDLATTTELNAKGHSGALDRFDYEKRYVRKDGSRVWVHVTVSMVRDEAGRFLRAVGTAEDVTDRRRAEEALEESRARIHAALASATDAVFVADADGRIVEMNDAFVRFHRFASREECETRLSEFPRLFDVLLPDGTPATVDQWAISRARRGETVAAAEFTLVRRDTGERWIGSFSSAPIHDPHGRIVGTVTVARDVTERKRAEEALRASEQRLRLALEAARMIAWEYDPRTKQVKMSENAAEVLALRSGRAHQDSDQGYSIIHPEDVERHRALVTEAIESAGSYVSVYRQVDERGGVFWLEERGRAVTDDSGRTVRLVGVTQNITERRRADEAIREANEKLREADRRKDEFLGMLSHELRNPLAPIRNALYILDHVQPAGQQARRAKDIVTRQVAHLTRLVDDLLDVTRIARGKIELRHEDLDLAALARRTAEDYRALVQDRGLELAVDVPPTPVLVNGDPARLTQVLGNLLNNAAKFTPAGGQVALSLRSYGDRAAVHVRDTGPGIAPEVLATIFEPFVQGKQTLARSEGGLGLGLSLVKGLVALHGGEVTAVSGGAGHGTEFVVTLPLARAASREAQEAGRGGASAPVPHAQRVLVVDDNRDAADSLAELVEMLGHTAVVAYDALTGLERASENLPDVVLCDIGLPGMDGYEFARQFRALTSGHRIRVVALSGYAQPEDVARAMEAGFDAHVAKPVDPPKIERLLSRGTPSRSERQGLTPP